jgi:hypothetical protein
VSRFKHSPRLGIALTSSRATRPEVPGPPVKASSAALQATGNVQFRRNWVRSVIFLPAVSGWTEPGAPVAGRAELYLRYRKF